MAVRNGIDWVYTAQNPANSGPVIQQQPVRKEVFFRLIQNGVNVRLCACDANGNIVPGGNILNIDVETGHLRRIGGVGRETGLALDSNGRAIIQ